MDKKSNSGISKIDYIEDDNIKRVANKKMWYSDIYFIAIFLVILGILLGILIIRNSMPNNREVFLSSGNIPVTISNNGYIEETITNNLFDKNNRYIIEKISSIEIKNEKENNNSILYNVRYEIIENSFPLNILSTTESNVLVRFSYSTDNVEWNYINNVISTSKSTINPLMGKYYDISGIVDNLKILSNKKLETNKIYWKCETIFQGRDKDINSVYKANFKIEYAKPNE